MSYHSSEPPSKSKSDSELRSLAVTISTLPNDIICEILQIIFAIGRETILQRLISQNYKENTITTTHVCRSWREAALHLPSLWNHVVIPLFSHNQILEYIARSGSAPLMVYVIGSKNFDAHNLQVLDMQFHRIREWYLHIPPGSIISPSLLSYSSRLSNPEKFWLHYTPFKGVIAYAKPPLHTSIIPSNLQKLSVTGFDFISDQVPAPFENLTYLTLQNMKISPKELHEFLSLYNNLEYLHLAQITHSQPRFPPIPYTPIKLEKKKLPKLHTFKLESSCISWIYQPGPDVLQNFILSSLTYVTIAWSGILPEHFTQTLASTLPHIPIVNTLDSLNVYVGPPCLAVEAIARDNFAEKKELRTKIVWRKATHIERPGDSSLFINKFIGNIALSARRFFNELRVFDLSFTGIETGVPNADELKELLNSMSSAETYIFHLIGDTGSYRNLRYILIEALASSSMFIDQSTVLVSRLRCVQLDGFYFGRQQRGYVVLRVLMEALSRRQELGCILPELHLKQAHGVTPAIIDGLRTVVGNVIWDEEAGSIIKSG